MQRPRLARILLSLLILTAVVGFAFGPVLRNDFVNWDDQSEITENPDFNPVSWTGLAWNWTHTRLTLYMPMSYMVWAGVAAIAPRTTSGVLQPFAFHLLNLGLHLGCAMLVFALIFQIWSRILPALAGALVFAVHPLQAEAVAWASGMYTLLSSLFSLVALNIYFFAFNRMRSSFALFLLATGFYLLALLTKAASVSLPLVAAVIDVLILGRPARQVARWVSPWVVIGVPFVIVAKRFQDLSQIAAPPWWGRPVIALDAFEFYLRKIAMPFGLIPDYGRNPNWVLQHPLATVGSVAIAIIALLAAWLICKRFAWAAAGICLLLAGISPYLGLTAFDFQYVSTVADRYAYFGLVGIAVIAAGVALRWRAAAVALLAMIVLWAVLTRRQVQRWQNTNSLFRYTLQVNDRSLISHNVFGYLAAREHRDADAEAHYLSALQIWPEDATIQFNLGNLYRKSDPARAIERYSLAVKYQPHFEVYRNSLAAELAGTGHAKEAYDQWQRAIALNPDYTDARNNLADLLINLGRPDDAAVQYHQVLQIDPRNAHATDRLRRLELPRGK